jgi:intein/homing endonuclease
MSKILLIEGGVQGHMNHLYDNPDLTFRELKGILKAASNGELEGTEKCIAPDSIIQLEKHGPMRIEDFVNSDIEDRVLSFNLDTKKSEYKSVLNKFNNDIDDEWLEITLENGIKLEVTPNHRIFVDSVGYVKAETLAVGDELVVNPSVLSGELFVGRPYRKT